MMQDNLIYAQQQFQHWRTHKRSGETIPSALWDLVQQLLESNHYKPYIIGKRLGISTAQLKKKFPSRFPIRATKSSVAPAIQTKPVSTCANLKVGAEHQQTTFVEAPLDNVALMTQPCASASKPVPTLTLQRTNGSQLHLVYPTSDILNRVLNHFITE